MKVSGHIFNEFAIDETTVLIELGKKERTS